MTTTEASSHPVVSTPTTEIIRMAKMADSTSARAAASSLPPQAPAAPEEAMPAGMRRESFTAMGTTITVLAPDAHGSRAVEATRALFDEWERALSRFLPESELSRLNAQAGAPVEVSPLLWDVLASALHAARAT